MVLTEGCHISRAVLLSYRAVPFLPSATIRGIIHRLHLANYCTRRGRRAGARSRGRLALNVNNCRSADNAGRPIPTITTVRRQYETRFQLFNGHRDDRVCALRSIDVTSQSSPVVPLSSLLDDFQQQLPTDRVPTTSTLPVSSFNIPSSSSSLLLQPSQSLFDCRAVCTLAPSGWPINTESPTYTLPAESSSLAPVSTVTDSVVDVAAAPPSVDRSRQFTCTSSSLPRSTLPSSNQRTELLDATDESSLQSLPGGTNTSLPTYCNQLSLQQPSSSISDEEDQLSDQDSDSWFDVRSSPSAEASFQSAMSELFESVSSSPCSPNATDLDSDIHSYSIPTVIGFRPSQRKQHHEHSGSLTTVNTAPFLMPGHNKTPFLCP